MTQDDTQPRLDDSEVLEALRLGLSRTKTAEHLGITTRGLYSRIKALKRKGKLNASGAIPGAVPGEGREIIRVSTRLSSTGQPQAFNVTEVPIRDPQDFVEPHGRRVRLSTYRGQDGEIIGQWDIRAFDKDDETYLKARMAMAEDLPRVAPVPPPSLYTSAALTNFITLSDTHIGGLSWAPETGEDWDLHIAEQTLTQTFLVAIQEMPPADHCFINLLGDWMHYDKADPVTTLSGNILSSDGRQEKMIDVAIRVARRIIAQALETHQRVTVLIAEGNHDIIGSIWLRKMFAALYEDEPRLTVVDSPFPFYATVIGDVFLGIHHGHLRSVGTKPSKVIKGAEELVAIFADEFAPLWGMTTKRYIHTGHLHNKVEVEPRGAQVIQHPTMAARDDYAARHGWGSLRNALGITYHETFGEKGRNLISPEMITNYREATAKA